MDTGQSSRTLQTAFLGGGCFWCLEAVYQRIRGVANVVSGYMGGHVANPSYEQVCGKTTGHAEVVRIDFDPAVVGYTEILDVFFTIHDPTTLNRQGNDVGPQYRSVIFSTSAEQTQMARQAITAFSGKAVTELIEVFGPDGYLLDTNEKKFWPAESEHQNYFRTHPYQGYCAFVVAPKVEKAEKKFKALLLD